jgi:DNA-binding winged helix-turn-helix (wHTH) protein/TolB-like protein
MNNEISSLREFGNFRLDVVKRVLWHEGEPVNLALKEIELLCVLTENGGEVVTKDELLNKIWHDSFVEESNLSRHIYVLRKTLKSLGERSDLIKTIPRRGYRFDGKVREIAASEIVVEKHTQTRTLIEIEGQTNEGVLASLFCPRHLASALAVLAVASFAAFGGYQYFESKTDNSKIRSIAVLPFKTVGSEKGNDRQGLGLADILITRLSGVKELKVRPTSAVMSFEDQDATGAGEKLKVDAVLEGTIYRIGDKIRVTARFVKTTDNSAIWTGEFEKLPQDGLRLQNDIALQIVDALALNLSGGEKNALNKRYTESTDAYQLYINGRYEWSKRSWGGMVEAQRFFRNALDKDPNFALAYVGLADTIGTSAEPAEAFPLIDKALEIDPNLAEAHATKGFLLMFHKWKWKEAEELYKRSIELNSGYAAAHHWYATLLAIQGRNAEAKTELQNALEINPLSHNFLADLGQVHYFAREYYRAKEYCGRALELYPDFQFAHEYLADIYLQTGEFDKAFDEEIKANRINSTFMSKSAEQKELLEAAFNKQKNIYGQSGINGYMRSKLKGDAKDPFDFYSNAMTFAFLGENEKALYNLERAFENRAFLSAFIKADPVFDGLRQERSFKEILRKMDLAE